MKSPVLEMGYSSTEIAETSRIEGAEPTERKEAEDL